MKNFMYYSDLLTTTYVKTTTWFDEFSTSPANLYVDKANEQRFILLAWNICKYLHLNAVYVSTLSSQAFRGFLFDGLSHCS